MVRPWLVKALQRTHRRIRERYPVLEERQPDGLTHWERIMQWPRPVHLMLGWPAHTEVLLLAELGEWECVHWVVSQFVRAGCNVLKHRDKLTHTAWESLSSTEKMEVGQSLFPPSQRSRGGDLTLSQGVSQEVVDGGVDEPLDG